MQVVIEGPQVTNEELIEHNRVRGLCKELGFEVVTTMPYYGNEPGIWVYLYPYVWKNGTQHDIRVKTNISWYRVVNTIDEVLTVLRDTKKILDLKENGQSSFR